MKKSNLIMVITMSLFFFGMFAWTVIADTPDYADSERRVLASFPEISAESILEGDFAEGFDEYAVERFPARDMWRGIKAYASKAFLQKDNNGICIIPLPIAKCNRTKITFEGMGNFTLKEICREYFEGCEFLNT